MDLNTYLQYRRECDRVELEHEEIDYEDFLGFLDIEHYLGLSGPDTWSTHGNRTQVLVKTRLAEILVEMTPPASELPGVYYDFAHELGEGDVVFSFNYDTILERALEHIGKPYRLWPQGADTSDGPKERDQEVILIKLHGSVDWFDRTAYADLQRIFAEHGLLEGPGDPVFGPGAAVRVVPLSEGIPDSDPMANVHRVVAGLEDLYRRPPLFSATPWLLTPSKVKAVYASRFSSFWFDVGRTGSMSLGMVVIGYSLPSHDEYAKQALFRLVRNYLDNWWDVEWPDGRRKAPILLIDKRNGEEARDDLLSRYGFMDPEKAIFHFDGFSQRAVGLIARDKGGN